MSEPHRLQFEREKTALKWFLDGRGYTECIKALGYVERYHVGLRKDGKTPELHHQVRIALSAIALNLPADIERQLILAILLHDVREDYGIPYKTIKKLFGKEAAVINEALTKKFGGVEKNKEEYIAELALLLIAALAKGLDRNDNLESMLGVFTPAKMLQYAEEAEKLFLQMLKKASKLYPEYNAAFVSIMTAMKQKIKWTRAYVEQCSKMESMVVTHRDQATTISDLHVKLEYHSEQVERHGVTIATQLEVLERENKRLQAELTVAREINCVTKLNKEHYASVIQIIKRFGNKIPIETQVSLAREMTLAFGISTLDLMSFNKDFTSGDINTTSILDVTGNRTLRDDWLREVNG